MKKENLKGLTPNFALIEAKTNSLLDIVVGDVLITSSNIEGEVVSLTNEELDFVSRSFDFTRGISQPVFCNKVLLV